MPKMPPGAPAAKIPAPPPVPREAREPHLRMVPPPPPSSAPPTRSSTPTLRAAPPPPPPKSAPPRAPALPREVKSTPPPLLPIATIPPRYVPPVPDDEEEGDTLVEGLEQDSFDANLMDMPAPPSGLAPIASKAARALEAATDDVVERIDEAMLALVEQRVVRPLYAIGGAMAVRALIVPALVIFGVGVAVGMPDGALDKTFPKAPAELAPAASAPVALALPAPVAPDPEPQPAVEEPAPIEAPAVAPRRSPSRRAIARQRARAERRAEARRERRVAQRARTRRARRAR